MPPTPKSRKSPKTSKTSGWDTPPPADTLNAIAEVGLLVRQYRENQGISQRELADLLGINNTYISKIESGKTSYRVSADLLCHIASYVGFDPNPYLLRMGIVPPDYQSLLTQLAFKYGDRLAEVLKSIL